jgi:hypothetical protein
MPKPMRAGRQIGRWPLARAGVLSAVVRKMSEKGLIAVIHHPQAGG